MDWLGQSVTRKKNWGGTKIWFARFIGKKPKITQQGKQGMALHGKEKKRWKKKEHITWTKQNEGRKKAQQTLATMFKH